MVQNYYKIHTKYIHFYTSFNLLLIKLAKRRITIDLDKSILDTINSLKNQTLEEDKLTYFSNHTSSKQAWYRFILQMGILKTKTDFEKFIKLDEK